jgi:predicted acylesterase/phospholipase RssA
MTIDQRQTVIACGGTGFKAAFAHGVLSALESHGFRAAAYAGSSLAAIPTACAAIAEAENTGIQLWLEAFEVLDLPGNGMSDLSLSQIAKIDPLLQAKLFAPEAPRVCIATTAVHTVAGAVETQGPRAGALGRRLLVHAGRRDRAWANEHLSAHLWDTQAPERSHRLIPGNIRDVLYASTRLLHGWQIPAEIDGIPFVDAVYTCSCPALEMSAMEYREIIAITGEPGPLYRDLFQSLAIPERSWRSRIRTVRPTTDPKSLGVEDTIASKKGLIALYDHGLDLGLRFIAEQIEVEPPPDTRWEWPKREEPPA